MISRIMRIIEPGQKFGYLEFVQDLHRLRNRHRLGLFRCRCGREVEREISRVFHGYQYSCGRCTSLFGGLKHGMHKTPEYYSWTAMLTRCHNPNAKDYLRWGAKGVTVCDAWRESFAAFLEHIGRRPKGTTLDRIDRTLPYQPGNVRWATAKQQNRNKSNHIVLDTPLGRMALVDYADAIGVTGDAVRLRLRRGKLVGCEEVRP